MRDNTGLHDFILCVIEEVLARISRHMWYKIETIGKKESFLNVVISYIIGVVVSKVGSLGDVALETLITHRRRLKSGGILFILSLSGTHFLDLEINLFQKHKCQDRHQ